MKTKLGDLNSQIVPPLIVCAGHVTPSHFKNVKREQTKIYT